MTAWREPCGGSSDSFGDAGSLFIIGHRGILLKFGYNPTKKNWKAKPSAEPRRTVRISGGTLQLGYNPTQHALHVSCDLSVASCTATTPHIYSGQRTGQYAIQLVKTLRVKERTSQTPINIQPKVCGLILTTGSPSNQAPRVFFFFCWTREQSILKRVHSSLHFDIIHPSKTHQTIKPFRF